MPGLRRPSKSTNASRKPQNSLSKGITQAKLPRLAELEPETATCNTFSKTLEKSGIVIDLTGNKIKHAGIVAQGLLTKFLADDDSSESTDGFIQGLEQYVQNEKAFLSLLLPTFLDESVLIQNVEPVQDSVMKMLLQCDVLQQGVISILLKKMPLYSENENTRLTPDLTASQGLRQNNVINVPRLMLNQLRWVNFLTDSNSFAKQLLEIAPVMQCSISCDIIAFIPDILINDTNHSEVATSLCEMLSAGDDEIAAAVFDSLSNLSLTDTTAEEVQEFALSHVSSAPLEQIYFAARYLLNTAATVEIAKQVISSLRSQIDYEILLKSASCREDVAKSNTKLLADGIFSSITTRSIVANGWLAVLDELNQGEWLPGDVVAMIQLCDSNISQQHKNHVTMMQQKFRNGFITRKCLKRTFSTCSHILFAHFKCICRTAQAMLWNCDPQVKNWGAVLYEMSLLYMGEGSRREAVGLILEHVSSASQESNHEVDAALKVLFRVAKVRAAHLQPHVTSLCELTNHLVAMTQNQIRLCLAVLSMVMSDEHGKNMEIQNHISSVSDRHGNVGVIWHASSLVISSQQQPGNGDSEQSKSDDPVLLHVAKTLDSLTYVFRTDLFQWSSFYHEICLATRLYGQIPDAVLRKIWHHAVAKLDDNFRKDDVNVDKHDERGLVRRFGLGQDLKCNFAVDVVNPKIQNASMCLCQLLSAVAYLEKSSETCVESLEHYLRLPVLLPDTALEKLERFETLSEEEAGRVLDGLFSCINWFRELVSTFCEDNGHHAHDENVLRRLSQLCLLQTTVTKLLLKGPFAYQPSNITSPNLHHQRSHTHIKQDITAKNLSRDSKKTSPTSQISSTISSIAAPKRKTSQKSPKFPKLMQKKPFDFHAYSQQVYFVELSCNVFQLLYHKLVFGDRNEVQPTSGPADEATQYPVAITEVHLILHDVHNKLQYFNKQIKPQHHLAMMNKSNSGAERAYARLDQLSSDEFISKCARIVPYLCKHAEDIVAFIDKKNLEIDESRYDDLMSGGVVSDYDVICRCFGLIMEIFLQMFTWVASKDVDSCLEESLMNIGDGSITTEQRPLHKIFKYFENFLPFLPNLDTASTLIKLLSAISCLADNKKSRAVISRKICVCCETILQKEWQLTDVVTSQSQNVMLSNVYTIYLQSCDDAVDCIETFMKNALSKLLSSCEQESPEADLAEETDVAYPSVSKQNFHIFHQKSLEVLVKQAGKIPQPKPQTPSSEIVDILLRWSEIIKVLDILIKVLKVLTSRAILGPALKQSQALLEAFIKKGISTCELAFNHHQDDVILLLKNVQLVTRQLQHMTCHSKVVKDASLTSRVPALKRCLESFVYRVKALLVLHNCGQAFWLGNLKNRNLKGEEISTQQVMESSSDDDDDDDATSSRLSNPSYSEAY